MDLLKEDARRCYAHYEQMLEKSVSRELARVILPVSTYTNLIWKMDAHNLMHFLQLRVDKKAQYEIRVYAEVILSIFAKWLPLTHAAFLEYRINAVRLSKTQVDVVRKLLAGSSEENLATAKAQMSISDWREFQTTFFQ